MAGPGSGKTRVLTQRIGRLIRQQGERPDSIVAITFTNRAAREMTGRLEELLGAEGRAVRAGTFHRFCGALLRNNAEAAGLKQGFSIYDREDQKIVARRVADITGLREQGSGDMGLLKAISYAKANLVRPDGLDRAIEDYTGEDADEMQLMAEPYALYEEQLHLCGAIDLDDMIVKTVQMLEASGSLLRASRRRFRHILVDEFQDTNHAQYRLATLLAGREGNLCVVGDPDQSIYGWRHADIRNILDFRTDHPNATEVHLGTNYRSTEAIVQGAQAMIRHNRNRIDNPLRGNGSRGEQIEGITGDSDRHEAEQVIAWAERMRQELNQPWNECAVMYRTHRNGRAFEEECVRTATPYRVVGGPRFYDRAEIRDCLAYLRLIHNPGDDVAFQRIINQPRRSIGAATVERLAAWAYRERQTMRQAADQLGGGLLGSPGGPTLGARAEGAVRRFATMMDDLDAASRAETLPGLFDAMLEQSGLERAIRNEEDGPDRWDNVMELRAVCAERDDGQNAANGALERFLEDVALVSQSNEPEADALTLISLHQAKGLEFEIVALTGLEEGTLPFWRNNDTEEERRLCYVGMTRAKRRLAVSWSLRKGPREMSPSRFQDEMENVYWTS